VNDPLTETRQQAKLRHQAMGNLLLPCIQSSRSKHAFY
jgi:hypothetical protein